VLIGDFYIVAKSDARLSANINDNGVQQNKDR